MTNKEGYRDCPGCGGGNITTETCFLSWIGPCRYLVMCNGCSEKTNLFRTEAEAIAAWNLKPEGEK